MICVGCPNRISRKFMNASETIEESYCKLDGFKIPMFGRALVECSEFPKEKQGQKKG